MVDNPVFDPLERTELFHYNGALCATVLIRSPVVCSAFLPPPRNLSFTSVIDGGGIYKNLRSSGYLPGFPLVFSCPCGQFGFFFFGPSLPQPQKNLTSRSRTRFLFMALCLPPTNPMNVPVSVCAINFAGSIVFALPYSFSPPCAWSDSCSKRINNPFFPSCVRASMMLFSPFSKIRLLILLTSFPSPSLNFLSSPLFPRFTPG